MGACREVSPPFTFLGARLASSAATLKTLGVSETLGTLGALKTLETLETLMPSSRPPGGRPQCLLQIGIFSLPLYNGVLIAVSCRQDHLDCSL